MDAYLDFELTSGGTGDTDPLPYELCLMYFLSGLIMLDIGLFFLELGTE